MLNDFAKKVCITAPSDAKGFVSFVEKMGGLISVGYEEDRIVVRARLRDEDIERLRGRKGIQVSLL